MCTGMLLNFHTVTRCPWRFAVRSSTEPHNSDRERSPRGVPALRPARPVTVPDASPSYAGLEPPRRTEASCAPTSVISTL